MTIGRPGTGGQQLQSHHPLRQHAFQGVREIDMADAIYVINVGGYIGESTRSEIEYARKMGKEVLFLEE